MIGSCRALLIDTRSAIPGYSLRLVSSRDLIPVLGINAIAEQAYFIAFSIIILHTDVFNKNNKHKMQRPDYLRNTSTEGIAEDILGCFYDNIAYTPFIHVDDELDQGSTKKPRGKRAVKRAAAAVADPVPKKASKSPLDPYTLIMDSKLDILRPPLREVMNLEDPYNYLGTAESLDVRTIQRSFFRCGVLQIVSPRSRPDAFMSPETTQNPQDAQAGLVEIKVTKVGILWRKGTKRKAGRSPWQEWGAILTGSQLYFFRNASWVKGLMHQHDTHQKLGHGTPVVFKPPLQDFKPDAFLPTEDSVALLDVTYKRHKHAFTFIRHGGVEEPFLADSEADMNDWLARLNYAAAFVTSGVRMRGLVGGNYEGQRNRAIRRLENKSSSTSLHHSSGDVVIQSGKIDPELAEEILTARREIMQKRVEEAEEKIVNTNKRLDSQLRDARHLLILAPIQQKTREQVVHAAGRMAAKLKWVRIEVWKMKCYRDILALDLEEEKRTTTETHLRNQKIAATAGSGPPASTPKKGGLLRLGSLASTIKGSQRSPQSPTTSARPSTALSTDVESDLEETLKSPPPEVAQQSSLASLPPTLDSDDAANALGPHKGSVGSTDASPPHPGSIARRSSRASSANDNILSPGLAAAISKLTAPTTEEKEQDVLRQAGLLSTDERVDAFDGSDPETNNALAGSPESRTKARRSLHRTLPRRSRSRHQRPSPQPQSSRLGLELRQRRDARQQRRRGRLVESPHELHAARQEGVGHHVRIGVAGRLRRGEAPVAETVARRRLELVGSGGQGRREPRGWLGHGRWHRFGHEPDHSHRDQHRRRVERVASGAESGGHTAEVDERGHAATGGGRRDRASSRHESERFVGSLSRCFGCRDWKNYVWRRF